MKPGDLVMFIWPTGNLELDHWEHARLGLIIEILVVRPEDKVGNELLILHEGERWSAPEVWCRPVRVVP